MIKMIAKMLKKILITLAICSGIVGTAVELTEVKLPIAVRNTELIGEFQVSPQDFCQVTLTLVAENKQPVPWQIEVRFYNDKNEDTVVTEKTLGIAPTRIRLETPVNWDGKTLTLTCEGTAPGSFSRPVKGAVWVIAPNDMTGKVTALRMTVGAASPAVGDSSGIEAAIPEKGFRFSVNPVPNPSFEDGADTVSNWHYTGTGSGKISNDSYAGARSLMLTNENAGGRWESDFFAISSNDPMRLFYWTKFSSYANPSGHRDPLQIEFFKADGTLVPGQSPEFRRGDWQVFYGDWFPVITKPISVPQGAVKARLVFEHRDKISSWNGDSIANWGNIMLDNVILLQSPDLPVAEKNRMSPYSAMAGQDIPFLPVGSKRQNSVNAFPILSYNANLFFKEDGENPVPKLGIINLLGISRKLSMRGKVSDAYGKVTGTFEDQIALPPYDWDERILPVPKPESFGAFYVEIEFFDNGKLCGKTSVRFGYLDHSPRITEAERLNWDYPFDMHPSGINADNEGTINAAELDFQMRILKLIGVRSIRLQSRFHGIDLDDPQKSVAGALQKVERWHKNVLPVMQKYQIKGWISLMEQGRNNLPEIPRNAKQLEAWRAYNRAQAEAFGNNVEFMLYGNEGLGHHTPDEFDVKLFQYSAFAGTVREWMELYRETYLAIKAGNPKLPVGPAHAGDADAKIVRQFFAVLGKDAPFDCWGFNAYGDTVGMGERIGNVIRANTDRDVFGVVPEVGLEVMTFGPGRATGELKQAVTIPQTYIETLARAPWVKRISWFIIAESGDGSKHNIFDKNWTPRPGVIAWMVMVDHLGAGRVESRIAIPGGGDFFIWRRIDGSAVGVGYSSSGQSVTLDTDAGELRSCDLFGNGEKVAVHGGTVSIQLDAIPHYITGAKILTESKKFEISARNITVDADNPQVGLELVNRTDRESVITVSCKAHPLVRVTPSKQNVTLRPGEHKIVPFDIRFMQRDDRRRTMLEFTAETADGMVFRTRLAHTFAMCVEAPANFRLDGDWSQWQRASKLRADQSNQVQIMGQSRWSGPEDLSAEVLTMWDEKNLYLGVRVRDDVRFVQKSPDRLFLADGLELGFDMEHKLSSQSILWQICVGSITDNASVVYRHLPGAGRQLKLPMGALVIRATGEKGNTEYKIAIPWSELGNFQPALGKEIGFGILVDDSDGNSGDRKFISWFGSGISNRQPQALGDLIFTR